MTGAFPGDNMFFFLLKKKNIYQYLNLVSLNSGDHYRHMEPLWLRT